MSKLVDDSITIYEAMQNIENGKYVMPAFQRQFVWSMEQVEKLWDSILLDYPIATFLFWHVDDTNVTWDTYFCQFMHEITFDSRKQADGCNYDLTSINTKLTDTAVLDGQQRLTSLYLSLFGQPYIRPNYARKKTGDRVLVKLLIELNKNKTDLDENEYNSKKHDVKFTVKIGRSSPTQFDIATIKDPKYHNTSTRNAAIESAISLVPMDSKDYARSILHKLCEKIYEEKLIRYTEITDMKQDDALEMFVRFNSGGKALRKSEITMSILEAYWPNAKSEFGKVLDDSYQYFGTDFIIRTALMLYGDVVKSNINKQIAEDMKNNWNDFKKALANTEALLKAQKIDVSRFSGSWNVLLPIIFCVYYNPDNYEDDLEGIMAYLLRAIFFTYFQSGTTSKLQQMKSNIISYNYQISKDMLNQIPDLIVTDGKIEDILNSEKGSRVAGEVLYYLSLDWYCSEYKYEQDHLHPYTSFDNSKPIGVTYEEWREWHTLRNRLPNLWLLVGSDNGSKNDLPLQAYYNSKNDAQRQVFVEQALIPSDKLLELRDFGKFFAERKELLDKKIKSLLN